MPRSQAPAWECVLNVCVTFYRNFLAYAKIATATFVCHFGCLLSMHSQRGRWERVRLVTRHIAPLVKFCLEFFIGFKGLKIQIFWS